MAKMIPDVNPMTIPNDQNLLQEQLINLASFQISRHRLTLNLRNTARINQWLKELIPDLTLRERLVQGPEVMLRAWKTEAEEGKWLKRKSSAW